MLLTLNQRSKLRKRRTYGSHRFDRDTHQFTTKTRECFSCQWRAIIPDCITTPGGITTGKLQSRWITTTESPLILSIRSFHHITAATLFLSLNAMNYCDSENVNILTSLLLKYGVKHIVVCPGSRNVPLVHNFNVCPEIVCHPITDERSAGFVALGITISTNTPVAVCVTSGSALLNLLPAVAEASYQHRGIIVISADRPAAWIDQLDGQTLPQHGALGSFVCKSVNLLEPHNNEERWYCKRLVCEAMTGLMYSGHKSIHINVPISEPFFRFTTKQLPDISPIVYTTDANYISNTLSKSHKPLIIIGQITDNTETLSRHLHTLSSDIVILSEALSGIFINLGDADRVLFRTNGNTTDMIPDTIIYIGGHIVSKRLRHFLRKATNASIWHVSETAEIQDVSTNMCGLLHVKSISDFILSLGHNIFSNIDHDFVEQWNKALTTSSFELAGKSPSYSQALAVMTFEKHIQDRNNITLFYANSTAVRLGNLFSRQHIMCNRGLNGIEGSLSTAAGYSLVSETNVFCVIGDLSFFYDQNALWNTGLKGNFRILLLNNSGGGIFHQLKGLEASEALDKYIAAKHFTTAEGICKQNRTAYRHVTSATELEDGIRWLVDCESDIPMLLEVSTDINDDTKEYKYLYE